MWPEKEAKKETNAERMEINKSELIETSGVLPSLAESWKSDVGRVIYMGIVALRYFYLYVDLEEAEKGFYYSEYCYVYAQ